MIDRLRELLRADVIDLFRDGSVTFSRERMEWAARGKDTGLRCRLVNEKAPNGALHARLASPVEDELLDTVPELLDAHDRMAGALRTVRVSLKGARGLALDNDETALDAEFALAIDVIDEALARTSLVSAEGRR